MDCRAAIAARNDAVGLQSRSPVIASEAKQSRKRNVIARTKSEAIQEKRIKNIN
jgi:hypothetical protein